MGVSCGPAPARQPSNYRAAPRTTGAGVRGKGTACAIILAAAHTGQPRATFAALPRDAPLQRPSFNATMTQTIDPVASQLPGILAALPQDRPLVMLNLLRFSEQARYRHSRGPGETPCSGREAYARYAEVAEKKVQAVGGQVVYMGRVKGLLIAPPDEHWDEVLLVRYPSASAFAAMLAMPDYMAATRHRTAALDDARLIATVEAPAQGV
jgi:uncharacterized protein (DUF1330 family)